MQISFESKDLPRDILELMSGNRVTVEVTFDVENISIHKADDGGGPDFPSSIGGSVRKHKITKKTGMAGLDPTVESGINKLRAIAPRTMGTMG